jgi:hypothetical protein
MNKDDLAGWNGGHAVDLYSGGGCVRIPARTPAILTEVFRSPSRQPSG